MSCDVCDCELEEAVLENSRICIKCKHNHDKNAIKLIRQAEKALEKGNLEDAKEYVKEVLEQKEDHDRANELMDEINERKKRRRINSSLSAARDAMEEEDLDEAMKQVKEAMELDANHQRVQTLKEEVERRREKQRKMEHARENLDRAEELIKSEKPEERNEAIELLRVVDKSDKLLPGIEKRLVKLRSLYYRQEGLHDRCLQELESLIKDLSFNEEHLEVYYRTARAYEENGRPEEARHIYNLFFENMYDDYRDVTERDRELNQKGVRVKEPDSAEEALDVNMDVKDMDGDEIEKYVEDCSLEGKYFSELDEALLIRIGDNRLPSIPVSDRDTTREKFKDKLQKRISSKKMSDIGFEEREVCMVKTKGAEEQFRMLMVKFTTTTSEGGRYQFSEARYGLRFFGNHPEKVNVKDYYLYIPEEPGEDEGVDEYNKSLYNKVIDFKNKNNDGLEDRFKTIRKIVRKAINSFQRV